MQVTIIPSENVVLIGGERQTVDCFALVTAGVHAIQWDGGVRGEIEFVNRPGQPFRPNETFEDITPYQAFIDAWQYAHDNPPPPPSPPFNSLLVDYDMGATIAAILGSPTGA